MSFTVAIAGRPNVGKSTLFNRLIEQRKAIVDDTAGVTRDRQYGMAEWNGKTFNVIDTGGFLTGSEDAFEKDIVRQLQIAIDEADAVLFLVDVTTGITAPDEELAERLRRSRKPVFLVVNKVDHFERQYDAAEFFRLGFSRTFFISSASGSGTGELLDELTRLIPAGAEPSENEKELPRFAIIGQPNTGKSSLLNALLGEERTIVSEVAGTTRDSIHTRYNLFQKDFILIDTAGIRRKNKVKEDLEFYSVIRAIKAMDEADVCLLLIDATQGITAQDLNIFSLAARKGKGILLLVNKWDLIPKTHKTAQEAEKEIRSRLQPFSDVPVLFISAKEKIRIYQAVEKALEVYENRKRKIPTSELNDTLLKVIEATPPPVVRGHPVKIKYITQLPSAVPSFAFFCNFPNDIKEPYRQFLENQLRRHFSFTGVPVRIFFRKK
ncbi:MAG: ribosome biogenesis GTPase Der [Chitinophagaceae bacterium]|nr:ribosome biogenesis GTPase Der [Chitinophagaceae bacterium]